MSKKDDVANTDLVDAVSQLKNSDNKTKETEEAVRAIEMASQMMDAIMAGRQLDLAFYGVYANSSIKKIRRIRKKKKKKN
jgi:hypothetical protein